MFAYNARPPDKRHVGDRWREIWIERMENNTPWVEEWLRHPQKDEFWRHGSVAENYDDIQCPVYMVGGWTDPYVPAIPRFLAGYSGPRKGLIGPWGHGYGHSKKPGPNMGFLQESLRWWDQWLKGIDTGINDEPMLRIWMPEAVEPQVQYDERPGRWVAESAWPSPNVRTKTYYLGDGTLEETAGAEVRLDHVGSQGTGQDAGDWGAWSDPPGLAGDQSQEDGLSLTFTSKPIDQRLEVLGSPKARLSVAADQPVAFISVRLCDVSPTGSSTLITRRLLNLTHRDGDDSPEPLEPGRRYDVTVALADMAYAVPAGHRLRVAISPTYWPWAWPSPEPVTLSLFAGECSAVDLPVRPPQATDAELPAFDPPEMAAPMESKTLRSGTCSREKRHDDLTGTFESTLKNDLGVRRQVASGLETGGTSLNRFKIVEGEPLSAFMECHRSEIIGRGEWQTRVETRSTWSSDATHFHLLNTLEGYEGDTRVFVKSWHASVPRELV